MLKISMRIDLYHDAISIYAGITDTYAVFTRWDRSFNLSLHVKYKCNSKWQKCLLIFYS